MAVIVSLPIPFLGRTTIGWIVDTTTIGAVILYGFASLTVFKASGQEGSKSRKDRIISGICIPIMVAFMVFLLFPGAFSDHTIETETYALIIAWSILGLIFFNWVIRKDHARTFGKAIIVWIALIVFIIVMSMTLAERVNEASGDAVIEDIHQYMDGTADSETLAMDEDEFLAVQTKRLHDADNASVLVIMGLFGVALAVMLVNYRSMQKWERKALEERDEAHTIAFTDPMTGVKSKHAFLLNEREFDTSIEEGATKEFAIVVCDVNGLKVINDTLGHKAGDEYIMSASKMVCDIFLHSPVYRVGGDEFVAVLTGRDYLARKELVQQLHDRSVEHIGTKDVVISGGLSDYRPGRDVSFHDVFERADARMYQEKQLLKSMGSITREDAEAS